MKLIFAALAVVSFAGTAQATDCVTVHMGRWTRTTCDNGWSQTTTRLGRYDYTTTTPPPAWQTQPSDRPPWLNDRPD
jgi:hypothetical protein